MSNVTHDFNAAQIAGSTDVCLILGDPVEQVVDHCSELALRAGAVNAIRLIQLNSSGPMPLFYVKKFTRQLCMLKFAAHASRQPFCQRTRSHLLT